MGGTYDAGVVASDRKRRKERTRWKCNECRGRDGDNPQRKADKSYDNLCKPDAGISFLFGIFSRRTAWMRDQCIVRRTPMLCNM